MTYIFLDTCVIIDCAYSRNKWSDPTLLDRLLCLCEEDDVKLLLSEVVLLELEKVAKGAAESAMKSLNDIREQAEANSKAKRFSKMLVNELKQEIRESENAITEGANRALDRVREIANDPDRSITIPIDATDILVATKIAIAGKKPSKKKSEWGLLQEDCQIIAGLERFVRAHKEDCVVLCSSNTTDFALRDGKKYDLHDDIAERLSCVTYTTNPFACIKEVQPDLYENEREELAQLGEIYESVSAVRMAEGLLAMGSMLSAAFEALEEQRLAFEEGRGLIALIKSFAEAISELPTREDRDSSNVGVPLLEVVDGCNEGPNFVVAAEEDASGAK